MSMLRDIALFTFGILCGMGLLVVIVNLSTKKMIGKFLNW